MLRRNLTYPGLIIIMLNWILVVKIFAAPLVIEGSVTGELRYTPEQLWETGTMVRLSTNLTLGGSAELQLTTNMNETRFVPMPQPPRDLKLTLSSTRLAMQSNLGSKPLRFIFGAIPLDYSRWFLQLDRSDGSLNRIPQGLTVTDDASILGTKTTFFLFKDPLDKNKATYGFQTKWRRDQLMLNGLYYAFFDQYPHVTEGQIIKVIQFDNRNIKFQGFFAEQGGLEKRTQALFLEKEIPLAPNITTFFTWRKFDPGFNPPHRDQTRSLINPYFRFLLDTDEGQTGLMRKIIISQKAYNLRLEQDDFSGKTCSVNRKNFTWNAKLDRYSFSGEWRMLDEARKDETLDNVITVAKEELIKAAISRQISLPIGKGNLTYQWLKKSGQEEWDYHGLELAVPVTLKDFGTIRIATGYKTLAPMKFSYFKVDYWAKGGLNIAVRYSTPYQQIRDVFLDYYNEQTTEGWVGYEMLNQAIRVIAQVNF